MTRAFFYGLFMDEGLLQEQGLNPIVVGPAKLCDYRITIADRATLVPAPGFQAYGMLIDLSDDELRELYSSPGVNDYRPERVDSILLEDGSTHRSVCYNLPIRSLSSVANRQYAKMLSRLLLELGFPENYARQIGDQADRREES